MNVNTLVKALTITLSINHVITFMDIFRDLIKGNHPDFNGIDMDKLQKNVFQESGVDTSSLFSTSHMMNMYNRPSNMMKTFTKCEYDKGFLPDNFGDPFDSNFLQNDNGYGILGGNCKTMSVPRNCDKTSKYRTINGGCNNINHPEWGMSGRPHARFIKAEYDDRKNSPRARGRNRKPLPNPRTVSNRLFRSTRTILDSRRTVLHMSFGQLTDHDLSLTPVITGANNSDINCCEERLRNTPECIPIQIPRNDPFFRRSCMNLVRSMAVPSRGGSSGVREQMNDLTSYLDSSDVYGSMDDTAASLREFSQGRLLMNTYDRLPKGGTGTCFFDTKEDYCQKAGDARVNVVPNLGSLQMIFLREHNRIASTLAFVNPHWNDETLFQEARRIVIAIKQHITYNEYLPLLINSRQMHKFNLFSTPHGFASVYNPNTDATIRNSFGAAVLRFGHSQIPNNQAYYNVHRRPHIVTPIEDTFHRPHMVIMDGGRGGEGVARWLTTEKALAVDRFFESGIRDKLFRDRNQISLDLTAINIQRGRDHGIPGYNRWRQLCHLPTARKFSDLRDHDAHAKQILSKLYSHPDDIDLYPGAMSEKPEHGSLLGPTFACILAKQFQALKKGDRFWYENRFSRTGFNEAQLNSIKRIKMSKVICNNVETLKMQKNAFVVLGSSNPAMSCRSFPDIDFHLWKER